jgi:nucleoside-triphosphatase THEP1
MENQEPTRIPIRQFRAKLKTLLASPNPIILTTHRRTTAILIPLRHLHHWNQREKRRDLARAKTQFRTAIQRIAASYW